MYTVTFGGWYQRTTLHLSEIHGFMAYGKSRLGLSKARLKSAHKSLNLRHVTRELGYLEYVLAETHDGIVIRYYEDGLYVLELEADDISKAQKKLLEYFQETFEPAISFIFSLGAPTPKLLAHIKVVHPTVVTMYDEKHASYNLDEVLFGPAYSTIDAKSFTVFKTESHIVIVAKKSAQDKVRELISTQVFFREFKDQLDSYLNIHRTIWEDIAALKEKEFIRGSDVDEHRAELDRYDKAINLISNRINQMGTFIATRGSISRRQELDDYLLEVFAYKFEVLADTLEYIKELWVMTNKYLQTAINNINDIRGQSTNRSVRSLQFITTIGVVSGILGYLSKDELPKFGFSGMVYFVLLMILTIGLNGLFTRFYKNKLYKLTIADHTKEI